MHSKSYQDALRVYGGSPAYQRAAADLITREANRIAERLGINEPVSIKPDNVGPANNGVSGTATSFNYYFEFTKGTLRHVAAANRLRIMRLGPDAGLASRPALIDKAGALDLARTWLTNLEIDLRALATKAATSMSQAPVRSDPPSGEPPFTNSRFTVAWLRADPMPAPLDSFAIGGQNVAIIVVEILGTNSQLIALTIEDPSVWTRPKLELKDGSEFVSAPNPTPAELMARIITHNVYTTIANADSFEASLWTSHELCSQPKKIRAGPVKVETAIAKKLSETILDLDSYNDFNQRLGCIPDDVAGLRVKCGGKEVFIGFCFNYHQLTVRSGSYTKFLNINRGQNRFVELLLEIFPNDFVLRSILFKPTAPSA